METHRLIEAKSGMGLILRPFKELSANELRRLQAFEAAVGYPPLVGVRVVAYGFFQGEPCIVTQTISDESCDEMGFCCPPDDPKVEIDFRTWLYFFDSETFREDEGWDGVEEGEFLEGDGTYDILKDLLPPWADSEVVSRFDESDWTAEDMRGFLEAHGVRAQEIPSPATRELVMRILAKPAEG